MKSQTFLLLVLPLVLPISGVNFEDTNITSECAAGEVSLEEVKPDTSAWMQRVVHFTGRCYNALQARALLRTRSTTGTYHYRQETKESPKVGLGKKDEHADLWGRDTRAPEVFPGAPCTAKTPEIFV